jgi:YXWGXW repeat-containing protein
MTRRLRFATLTLLFGALLAPAAHADTRFDVRIGVPGPPVVAYAPPPAYRGLVWQPGYYVWTGHRRHWIPGAWIRPAYGYRRPGWAAERRGFDRRDYRGDRRWDRGGWRDRGWRR